MNLDDIRIVGEPLVVATSAEVDELAERLWITFPEGYHEFIARFGEGVLGDLFVRIYPPWRIEKELLGWRRRLSKHWLWEEGSELLPKERALECVIIGDTLGGDELIFHPTRPHRLFVLPRDSKEIFYVGEDLMTAIEWICTSGELVKPFTGRDFKPFDSRSTDVSGESAEASIDPEGESLDDIVELVKNWAIRHKVKKAARKELRKQSPKGSKAVLEFEGILTDGQFVLGGEYSVAWSLLDKETKTPLGFFRWAKGDLHEGSSYTPEN